jgi:hypothetical protein
MAEINRSTVASNAALLFTALPLSIAEAELQHTVTVAEFAAQESYGEGCSLGYTQAEAWIANPKRHDPHCGGTLQEFLLDYAQRFADAGNDTERSRVRGEIVGFSCRLEWSGKPGTRLQS